MKKLMTLLCYVLSTGISYAGSFTVGDVVCLKSGSIKGVISSTNIMGGYVRVEFYEYSSNGVNVSVGGNGLIAGGDAYSGGRFITKELKGIVLSKEEECDRLSDVSHK